MVKFAAQHGLNFPPLRGNFIFRLDFVRKTNLKIPFLAWHEDCLLRFKEGNLCPVSGIPASDPAMRSQVRHRKLS
jgi:hypothetical protein